MIKIKEWCISLMVTIGKEKLGRWVFLGLLGSTWVYLDLIEWYRLLKAISGGMGWMGWDGWDGMGWISGWS